MAQSTLHFLAQRQGQIDHTSLEPQDTSCVALESPMQTRLCWRGNMKSNGTVMKSNSTLTLVQSIYDYVHLALWATLAAFVVFFLAFIAPRLCLRPPHEPDSCTAAMNARLRIAAA